MAGGYGQGRHRPPLPLRAAAASTQDVGGTWRRRYCHVACHTRLDLATYFLLRSLSVFPSSTGSTQILLHSTNLLVDTKNLWIMIDSPVPSINQISVRALRVMSALTQPVGPGLAPNSGSSLLSAPLPRRIPFSLSNTVLTPTHTYYEHAGLQPQQASALGSRTTQFISSLSA